MEPNTPDPRKHSLFDLFRDPERLGRELGRAYRQLYEILYPPTISPEEHAAELNRIELLEAQVKALSEQHTQDQEANRQLLLQVVEQDKKLSEIIAILKKSTLPQDKEQLTRWQQLRKRLWVVVVALFGVEGLLGPKGIAEAIRDVWAQETFWPVIKALPKEAQEAWQKVIESPHPSQPASALSAPTSTLGSPLPTETSKAQSTSLLIGDLPEMVLIPAEEFLMGSDKGLDPSAEYDEMPQHRVYLAAYMISRYPITNAQYKIFVDATGYKAQIPLYKSKHPVVSVNWYDAQKYCDWLSQITGRLYRLPTEAEWEKAARGTDGRRVPWGKYDPAERNDNFLEQEWWDTEPVDQYPAGASPYGVLDMVGNVWEWTSSLYKEYPYKFDDSREDPKAAGKRTLRGGSFNAGGHFFRCTARLNSDPDLRYEDVGFRVVSSGF